MTTDEARREEIRIMSLPKMQEFFRERMGPLRVMDYIHSIPHFRDGIVSKAYNELVEFVDVNVNTGSLHMLSRSEDELVKRYPLPIDRENPERGCWFMLTKENRTDKTFLNELAISDYPSLVILKKLVSQEGVEI